MIRKSLRFSSCSVTFYFYSWYADLNIFYYCCCCYIHHLSSANRTATKWNLKQQFVLHCDFQCANHALRLSLGNCLLRCSFTLAPNISFEAFDMTAHDMRLCDAVILTCCENWDKRQGNVFLFVQTRPKNLLEMRGMLLCQCACILLFLLQIGPASGNISSQTAHSVCLASCHHDSPPTVFSSIQDSSLRPRGLILYLDASGGV